MTTVHVMTDPRVGLVDVLKTKIAASYPAVVVRSTIPKGWKPETGPVLLLVEYDGTTGAAWPVATTSTIRLTVWSGGPSPEGLLELALAVALGCPVPNVARAHPGTWPIEATDSTTKARLKSATVLLTARTTEKEIS